MSQDRADLQQDEQERARRKLRTGVVVSDAMEKTVVVRISTQVRHPMYLSLIHI